MTVGETVFSWEDPDLADINAALPFTIGTGVAPPVQGITLGQPVTSTGANIVDAAGNGISAGVATVEHAAGNALTGSLTQMTPYLILGGLAVGIILIARR